MKKELSDLHNHLFKELERLGDDSLTDREKIETEAIRARSICQVSMQVLAYGNLVAKVYDLVDGSFGKARLPEFFGAAANEIENKPRLLKRNA
jgi:hypothetical protein